MGYTEALYDFPACNHVKELSSDNIGYVQGVFDDGVPFEAELWQVNGKDLYLGILMPDIISNAYKRVKKESESNITKFRYQEQGMDMGMLIIGMVNEGEEDGYDLPFYIANYLKENNVIEFPGNTENAYVHYLTDIKGNSLIRTIITLEENDEVLAECDLSFRPFVSNNRTKLRLV